MKAKTRSKKISSKLYNEAWASVEPLMFEYHDRKLKLATANDIITSDEAHKIRNEYIAVRTAILQDYGVTFEELEAETDRLLTSTKDGRKNGR